MKLLIPLFFLIFLPGNFTEAQSNLSYGEQKLTIDLEPLYPAPDSDFTAIANDYSLPVQGNSIRWFVDGKLLEDSLNQREIKLSTKELGTKTTIELVIDIQGGGSVSVKRVIEPNYLDIIIEPQTRTPVFYQGRALPSVESTVNATAIVNGNTIHPASLIYTWILNGKVLENGSVRGKNNLTFTMPRGRYATLGLEVRRLDGETIARKIFDLPSVTPSISFYEVSTLYGLKEKAVGSNFSLQGNSTAVRAEPYYLDIRTYNKPDLTEWKISNSTIKNPNRNPYEITLSSQGAGGASELSFHVRNTTQLLQGAIHSVQINY